VIFTSGQNYFLILKDIKRRKRFGFLLRNKGNLTRYIKHLVLLVKQQNRCIKVQPSVTNDSYHRLYRK
jgi:hypothetical protein